MQINKNYIAKRRKDCFEIYNKEKGNWNNVKGNRYDQETDTCFVRYSGTSKKLSRDECKKLWGDENGKIGPVLFQDYWLCVENIFEQEF